MSYIRPSAAHRNNTPVRSYFLMQMAVTVALCVWCTLAASFAQQPPAIETSTPSDTDRAEFDSLLKSLESDSFTVREVAKERLVELGLPIFPLLDRALGEANANVSTQILEIFSQFALDAEAPETQQVVRSLKRLIAGESTIKSNQAKQLLESIRQLHRSRAIQELEALGVRIVVGAYPLNGRTGIQQLYFVEIDDRFQGKAEDLVWMQWLDQVELVVFSGPSIQGEYLRYLADMPSLKQLLIRETLLKTEDIKWLSQIEYLDHLEIQYTPIDDQAADLLARLPVWNSMRIFGTEISLEQGEALGKKLDGIEFQFGCGGFLGIQSDAAAMRSSTVDNVTPGGAADLAGIMAGDVITKINEAKIQSFDEIRANLRSRRPGEKIMVQLERPSADGNMKKMQVEVTLGKQSNY